MHRYESSWCRNIEVLIDEDTLQRRVVELAEQIQADYAGKKLCVVGVLKGCFMFFADLVRHIDAPLSCQFVGISSYGDATETSGVVKITSDLTQSIQGLDVLLVEDIIDSGLTMRYLLENFSTRKPRSLKVCSLLHKPTNARVNVPLDYVGFEIPNAFVVGYGLDVAGMYRNLPLIGIYHEDL